MNFGANIWYNFSKASDLKIVKKKLRRKKNEHLFLFVRKLRQHQGPPYL